MLKSSPGKPSSQKVKAENLIEAESARVSVSQADETIKVAVRVRPVIPREIGKEEVVEIMSHNMLQVTD